MNNAAFRILLLLAVASVTVTAGIAGESAGRIRRRISPKIVGGNDVSGIYPYQASIRKNGVHLCGGALLNHRWIVTAAHCLSSSEDNYIVVLGTRDAIAGGIAYFVEKIVMYPHYDEDTNEHDIGLIKLTEDVAYTKFIAPVNLPTRDIDETNCIAVFTGWGYREKNGPMYNMLQEIFLRVLDWRKCKNIYEKITANNICTMNTFGEGICYGDSGSPLVLFPDNVQIGIGSYGIPCAVGKPDVHTRVYSYVDWIKSTIQKP